MNPPGTLTALQAIRNAFIAACWGASFLYALTIWIPA